MRFLEFVSLIEEEDLVISILKNYKKRGYSFSNVANNGDMVSVQIDFKFKGNKKDNTWSSDKVKDENEVLQIVATKALKELDIFKDPFNTTIINNKSQIRYGVIKYASYWVDKGAKISFIVETPKYNINTENDIKLIRSVIKNKVNKIFNKDTKSAIKESLEVIMGEDDFPSDLEVIDFKLDDGKKAFRIYSKRRDLIGLDYKRLEFLSTKNKDSFNNILSIELLKALKKRYKLLNIDRVKSYVDVQSAATSDRNLYYFTVFASK
jgi:hypothetical protein